MPSEITHIHVEAADIPAVDHDDATPYIALLVETAPGEAVLMPAERRGKDIKPTGDAAILHGSIAPGAGLWRALNSNGWKWVQDGAFGQKYWRRDTLESSGTTRKPRRR